MFTEKQLDLIGTYQTLRDACASQDAKLASGDIEQWRYDRFMPSFKTNLQESLQQLEVEGITKAQADAWLAQFHTFRNKFVIEPAVYGAAASTMLELLGTSEQEHVLASGTATIFLQSQYPERQTFVSVTDGEYNHLLFTQVTRAYHSELHTHSVELNAENTRALLSWLVGRMVKEEEASLQQMDPAVPDDALLGDLDDQAF